MKPKTEIDPGNSSVHYRSLPEPQVPLRILLGLVVLLAVLGVVTLRLVHR